MAKLVPSEGVPDTTPMSLNMGEPITVLKALEMKPEQIYALSEPQLLQLGSLVDLVSRSEVCPHDRQELANLSALVESAIGQRGGNAIDTFLDLHLFPRSND